jgi:hypothetical protein
MSTCDHSTPQWHLADCNEDGWKCAECGASLGDDGFSPDHDRVHIRDKVETILFWLVEHDFLYVSNATEADGITAQVANQCRSVDAYGQQFIVYHLAAYRLPRHVEFWREQAKQAMCSHPSRTLAGDVAKCNACGHEARQRAAGPLFESKEPF